ncbi:hypothetical protein PIB30_064384 [Stylosanthes scabra]|uniref:Uncharacterized protein n=1 Tax=Stylosanthes scabra TaxID=79078 RepID=A0ABU6QMA1_9FABA|nr:hypothetical protein [Stylosanthes scabra]
MGYNRKAEKAESGNNMEDGIKVEEFISSQEGNKSKEEQASREKDEEEGVGVRMEMENNNANEEKSQSQELEFAINRLRARWNRSKERKEGKIVNDNDKSFLVNQESMESPFRRKYGESSKPVGKTLRLMQLDGIIGDGANLKIKEIKHGTDTQKNQHNGTAGTENVIMEEQEVNQKKKAIMKTRDKVKQKEKK